MEDSRIVDLFFERSEQAIDELLNKYGKAAEHTAGNILNDKSDVEECMNDASLAMWKAIPPERPGNLKAYYLTVARNTALTRYHANTAGKRNSFYDTALDELEDCLASSEDPAEEAEAGELAEAVNAFLRKLPKEDRQMFVCRYWLADTVEEIAAKLRCRSGRVSVRLFRTRQKLKTYLIKEGLL